MKEVIRFENIDRFYSESNVQANNKVSFSVTQGEIHAICGENGAGKSTLMNILFGLEQADSGSMYVKGIPVNFKNPAEAIETGIGMVHQHFMVVNSFTVAQNVLLGMETNTYGLLNHRKEVAFVSDLSKKYHLPIDPNAITETLPVGLLQRLEILKMLARNVSILILDEPTAVLTPSEVQEFLKTLRILAREGTTILFISHKLQEVLDVSDRITVMRKGSVIGTRETRKTTLAELANMMVGRDVIFQVPRKEAHVGAIVLSVENLGYRNGNGITKLDSVSLHICAGEIYGLAGVTGNGQDALVSCICGMVQPTSGNVCLQGKDISRLSVQSRRKEGIAHVPEDRIAMGLSPQSSVSDNVLLGFQDRKEFRKGCLLNPEVCEDHAQKIIDSYSIAGATVDGPVVKLSGGNMQKVVLGRELATHPKLLIVNQPTRGLDVGSIEFVHRMIVEQRDSGVAILLVSVELEEILSLSDRVGVMFSGRLQGELQGPQINENTIGLLMVGGVLANEK
ncbi:ABC transporter ATP-binding protein [uncultured Sphaerochaeta sp.]|uniref:ABC transporter ATP-binding protein n=1 Tax=uncultured Sphaerochaeta sp. TaxID=886478 RepID=UPI002A0A41A0|nr:ABC transporter ATP-binding protein [uncultured Sphaerochaeta sp.]